MLETNDIKIEKIELETTKISAIFKDPEVTNEKYNFLNNQLSRYKFYLNTEYSFKYELRYDNSSKLLSIYINKIIPDKYIPADPNKANEILVEPINTFQMLYDTLNEIYKRKHHI